MSAQDCIKAIKDAVGEENFSDDLANEVYTRLAKNTRRKMRDNPSLSQEKAMREAAEELSQEELLAALYQKRTELENAIKKARKVDEIARAPSASKGLRAAVYGIEGSFYGAGNSTDAKIHALRQSMRGALVHDLKAAGLLEAARKREPGFELEVAREMSRLNGNTKIAESKNAAVRGLAGVLQKHVEAARLVQNDAGAMVRKLDGYVTRQTHDQVKIDRAGFEAWRNKIEPLLDERTFDDLDEGPVARTRFLQAVYTNLASGNHLKAGQASDFMGGFKGPGNLAKRASAERVLHFKGPDEFMAYNSEFGRGTLFESVLDAVDYGARNAALMRDWGTNPEAMLNAIRDKLVLDAKKAGAPTKEIQAIGGGDIQRAFNDLTQSVDIPGSITIARVGSSIRLVQAMAKLGGMLFSSFADLGNRAAMLRHNGKNVGEGLSSGVADLFRNYNGTERRQIADLVGAGIDGITGDIFRQMSSMDTTPGRLAKVADRFFKLTGQTWWQDSHMRGIAIILSRELADNVKKPLADLDPRLQTTLRRYGITEREWSALSKLDGRAADGRTYITPDLVRELDDAAVLDLIGKQAGEPKLAPGTVRLYHGGSPDPSDKTMTLWVTRSKTDAEGWASRGSSMNVWYVDVPENDPRIAQYAGDLANGIAPVSRFELPAELAKGRKILADKAPAAREINAAKRDLEAKLQTYLHDQVREGMNIAGARERSMLNAGTAAGTYAGEAIRILMQFKTYPVTFVRKTLGRELFRDGVDYAGVGQLLATTTILGMASLAVKDLAKGREPRWPEDPADQAKLWMAAMKQGGGLGLYGDFLLGEVNRVGGGWANTILGPTFGGTLGDVEKVFNAIRKGEDPRAQGLRATLNNAPFANLFYARWALDYTFLYSLQDSLDPGSVRRMQRRIERDNKQDFVLPPTNYLRDPLTNVQQLGRDISR